MKIETITLFGAFPLYAMPLTCDGEEDGAGGDDTAAGAGGDDTAAGAAGDDTVAGAGDADKPWFGDDLDDDLKTFVGDRGAVDLIKYAKSQRDAAGAREADVISKSGLVKPPAQDGEAGEFFQQFKPTEASAYAKSMGLEEDKISEAGKIEMEAAHKAGMHVDQFKQFREEQRILQETAGKAHAEALVSEINAEWKTDAPANNEAVERAVKALGLSDGFSEAISSPGLDATPSDYKAILNGLKDIGLNMKEGPGTIEGDAAGESVEDKLRNLEEEIVANDGIATEDQKRRRAELIAEKAES